MLTFTNTGLLIPANGIPITADELYNAFVSPFPDSETRALLFRDWTNYNRLLRHEIGVGFTQWINGSFVTQKHNPKDIDVVSFTPSAVFRKF